MNALLEKYDVPAPRYTSYPTVPYWQEEAPTEEQWLQHVRQAFEASEGISLYIHLPFCEKLCTYCGCNKRITKNHGVEQPYINTVLKEWKMYLDALPGKPVLKEIHLGGGTPTFFSPENLRYLLESIFEGAIVPEAHEFG
ncbi:MAG: coproporphyrinogen III oxidase, partial [Bacteroidetes bacterium]